MDEWLKINIPKKLSESKLPTKLDIIRACLFEKKTSPGKKRLTLDDAADIVTKQVQRIYLDVGIGTVRKDKIKCEVKKCFNSRSVICKTPRLKRHLENSSKKREEYVANLTNIFNVAEKKRKEINSSVKENVTQNPYDDMGPKSKRKAAIVSGNKIASVTKHTLETLDDSVNQNNDNVDYVDYDPGRKSVTVYSKRIDLSEIVEVQSRYSYSNRGVAALVNATLRTFEIPVVIDKNRVQRAQQKAVQNNFKDDPVFAGEFLVLLSRK